MSKMTMQAIVEGVEPRVIKAGTPDQRTIYDVIDNSGVKWTAWERPVAEKAWALKGKTSAWTVEQKQNGQYTNRTLVSIDSAQAADMHDAFGGGFPATPAAAPFQPQPAAPATFDAPGSTPTAKDTSIHRQTAGKVVAALAAAGGMTPEEFWNNITDLVHYFETGETPYAAPNVASDTGPAFPAEAEQPPVQTDDDIPF